MTVFVEEIFELILLIENRWIRKILKKLTPYFFLWIALHYFDTFKCTLTIIRFIDSFFDFNCFSLSIFLGKKYIKSPKFFQQYQCNKSYMYYEERFFSLDNKGTF